LTTGSLWAVALGVCLSVAGFASGSDLQPPNATAQTGAVQSRDPIFGSVSEIGGGIQSSVAAHPSGLVLEFHKTEDRVMKNIWYHVGKRNGSSVTWGQSQFSGNDGYWPTVTLSKEGYVIFAHSTGNGYGG
jgi:hypothetical protein